MTGLKRFFTVTAAVLAAMILCGCPKKDSEAVPADAEESLSAEETDQPPAKNYVHFLAAGDNLVHRSIFEQAHKRANNLDYDFTYAYSNAADLVDAADLAMINQETLICNGLIEPSDYPYFNSPPQLGDHMLYIGFDIFTIANNHVLDYGQTGLENCLDYWDSRPKALVAGVYRDKDDKENIRTITCNDITFSILSYTENTNGNYLPDGSTMIIGDACDIEGIEDDIIQAKRVSDICVVALHWGTEDSDEVSQNQRETAQKLADAGADVIVGTHPHVLRKIEMIDRKDGEKTLCAYSLGNFISGQSKKQNLIGGILEFDVEPEGSRFNITNVTLTPVISHYGDNYSGNRVYLYSQYSDELAASHGINEWTDFSMSYINEILHKNIGDEYLRLD